MALFSVNPFSPYVVYVLDPTPGRKGWTPFLSFEDRSAAFNCFDGVCNDYADKSVRLWDGYKKVWVERLMA
jgi:hypothetical protein